MKNISKILLPVAGIVLAIASSVVGSKNQEAQIDKAVAKKVAEALADQTK